MAAETGCVLDFTSDPNLACTGKEWCIDRHRRHHIGVVSGPWRVEFEAHDDEALDELWRRCLN